MTRVRLAVAGNIVLLLLATYVAWEAREVGTWDLTLFVALAIVVVGADLLPIETPRMRISMSASFLGLILAMALLGPTAAAIMGVASVAADSLRVRVRAPVMLANLAAFALFPLVGGLAMAWLSGATGVGVADPSWIFVMVPAFVAAAAVNYAVVLATLQAVDGGSTLARLRSAAIPVIPSDMTMLLLASLIVYAEAHVGPMALVCLVGLLFLYLWLYRELLTSQERAEELDTRTHQLATLQVGVLTAMLRTLALRDHMTARHSAAVARYARELARAAGCSDDEVELVHTAGLLHDIGKFIFPDHILLADSRLSDEDWEIVKCHPFQGAKIVREVEGYGPVADIILGHHERIDGKGYPRGMQGEEIPLLARVISVCDTYDVMTARDSYREPVPQDAALEELRRVAGKQLDARLVEIFADLVSRGELGFRHGDDADFEAELQFERRVRDYAAPQPHAVPAAA